MQKSHIHTVAFQAVDKVLLPPWFDYSIVDLVIEDQEFATLVELVVSSQLIATLSMGGPFTIFAPTDEAFITTITALTGTDASSVASLVPTLVSPAMVTALLVRTSIYSLRDFESTLDLFLLFRYSNYSDTIRHFRIIMLSKDYTLPLPFPMA
jgi:hypothetical protein